ncbi:hypothetical protein SARC_11791 [Sphaeroforma arctica JP610]|uniref:tRNA (adenine(58)-N(1))-methyltransferase n=1 Tax=Sphaeroforma arctica JP610 TaxID=667725 RepID=A0A0L0FGV5_9EUKA|nr:hypothetical protein SARC_11791 [Sphaeroforma arctica JP610]KNC75691.1 hypothetical protein SARC_11791 [Sphaeroforma arctica JP610]|eukprot:XP_014149593.1 hypothetical protein SARC_11791 [Sphaeroforma arctica JP610]
MQFVTIKDGDFTNNKSGTFKHTDLIGQRYGAKVQATMGFCHVLKPSAELWTSSLPHRTQILYTPDISMITMRLCLKPGSVVVESGTGSGSLSHAMVRSIAPTGHLYTFDFHEERVAQAKSDFKTHAVDNMVTSTHRDVMGTGFGLTGVADAVFLDLPGPWEAVPSAKQALKAEGGLVCSFSPCIEQVQRTCQALRDEGFVELETLETLQKPCHTNSFEIPEAEFRTLEHFEAMEKERVELEAMEMNDRPPKQKMAKKPPPEMHTVLHTRTMDKLAGHTGYLTFARIYQT